MKKILIPIIILILFGGGAAYLLMRPKANTTSSVVSQNSKAASVGIEPTQNEARKEEKSDIVTSIKDLVAKGIPQRCTFDYQDEETGQNTGTMFVAGQKIRGDFTIKDSDGNVTNGGMISDESYLYTWDSTTKEGFKMALTEDIKKQSEDITSNPSKMFDMDKEADYTCTPWIVETGVFSPPSDVEFADFTDMMNSFNDSMLSITPPKGEE